jgi:hypothetical protein
LETIRSLQLVETPSRSVYQLSTDGELPEEAFVDGPLMIKTRLF